MADFPLSFSGNQQLISSAGPYTAIGRALAGSAGTGFFNAVTAAWPAANRAFYIPFEVNSPVVAKQMMWDNGATVAGNIDVGIYTTGKTRLVSWTSQAMAGVSVAQVADITDTLLMPGVYFMAMISDSATATVRCCNALSTQTALVGGFQQQAVGAANLPSTATMANPNGFIVPFLSVVCAAVA